MLCVQIGWTSAPMVFKILSHESYVNKALVSWKKFNDIKPKS